MAERPVVGPIRGGAVASTLQPVQPQPGAATDPNLAALLNILTPAMNQTLPTGAQQVSPGSFNLAPPQDVALPRAPEPNNLAPLLATLGGVGLNIFGALKGRGAVGQSLLGVAEDLQRNALQKQAQEQRFLEEQSQRQQAFQEKSRVFQTQKKQALASAKLAEGIEDPRMKEVVRNLALSGQTDEANRLLLGIEAGKISQDRAESLAKFRQSLQLQVPGASDAIISGLQSGNLTPDADKETMRAFLAGTLKRRITDKELSAIETTLKKQGLLEKERGVLSRIYDFISGGASAPSEATPQASAAKKPSPAEAREMLRQRGIIK
jgi:hypothetical protein